MEFTLLVNTGLLLAIVGYIVKVERRITRIETFLEIRNQYKKIKN